MNFKDIEGTGLKKILLQLGLQNHKMQSCGSGAGAVKKGENWDEMEIVYFKIKFINLCFVNRI